MSLNQQKESKSNNEKSLPITTIEMEVAIAKLFGIRQHIIVPNISWGFNMHECDLFIIKKSGLSVEVEIKISKSDFLKDFDKWHQHKDRSNRINEFYYAFPEDIYLKCEDKIPVNAGIITCQRWKNYKREDIVIAKIIRQPQKIRGARKLTVEEQLKVARLGSMRIWTLKEKLIKNGITKKVRKSSKREH